MERTPSPSARPTGMLGYYPQLGVFFGGIRLMALLKEHLFGEVNTCFAGLSSLTRWPLMPLCTEICIPQAVEATGKTVAFAKCSTHGDARLVSPALSYEGYVLGFRDVGLELFWGLLVLASPTSFSSRCCRAAGPCPGDRARTVICVQERRF